MSRGQNELISKFKIAADDVIIVEVGYENSYNSTGIKRELV